MPLALLLCNSSNNYKVDLFYSLFVNDQKEFALCEDLEEFIYYLFITPSTCSFRALKRIAENFPDSLNAISAEEFANKTDAFEIEDINRLKEIFMKDFFKGKSSLTKIEFEEKFIKEDFGWIFSPCGIRCFLEKNNDVKEQS